MSTSDHCINQTYFQSMEPRVLDPIIQARHEQSQAGSTDPATVLTYLAFLEQKIGHLRGIICSTPHPQQQIVAAELSCIIVQLASISRNLIPGDPASAHGGEDDVKSSPPPCANAHEGSDSDHDHHVEEADVEHDSLPPGSYEVIQIEKEEILAPHVHYCKVCGKGFKRDANLRMHMRGHGDEYKTAAALAKPSSSPEAATATAKRYFYSCPFVGCKRNKEHKKFQPLKSPICVKNHYRRSHCDKSYTCRRCNVKKFSVLADLRTHEKHCGRDRWVCSCGTSFSRKDKLFGHVAVFDGHTPALPADEDAADGGASGSDQPLLKDTTEAASRTANSSERFSESGFDGTCRSFDINGIDDGRGYLSPMGLDSCDFAGFDLFGAPAIDFWYQTET